MLKELLDELGACYGDIEVHNALFEANGLEATPAILAKIKNLSKNVMLDKLTQKLNVILKEAGFSCSELNKIAHKNIC